MHYFRRIFLFVAVNALVIISISVIFALLGVGPYLSEQGINYKSLAIFCAVWGMGGAFISLLMSRKIAKMSMKVKVINPKKCSKENKALYDMVMALAKKAKLNGEPEVGVFENAQPNAFATGPSAKKSLVAVSSGLLDLMDKGEVEAVLAHEIAHIKNGDMVTMTLLQGVVNAFVLFLARILAFALSSMSRGNQGGRGGFSMGSYLMFQVLFDVVFMALGSMVIAAYSRRREYRADAGSAKLCGKQPMIDALKELGQVKITKAQEKRTPDGVKALMINSVKEKKPSLFMRLFATHPPIPDRIRAIKELDVRSVWS